MATIGRLYYGSNLLIGPSWPLSVELGSAVNVTADASTHTKGAWTELIASTDAAARWLAVSITNFTNATDTAALLDIGTGASGSETVRIANIGAGMASNILHMFPLSVASGTRIAARSQSTIASRNVNVVAGVFDDEGGLSLPTTLDTIGATTGTSRGTNLPNTSFHEITNSTSQAYQGLVCSVTVGGTNSIALTSLSVTVAKGGSGSEIDLFSFSVLQDGTELQVLARGQLPAVYLGHIPAGTRLAVKRSAGSANTDVILHGVPY
jgi:hypothetical protein